MTKPAVVDADGHILEPTELWERYLEPQYRDRAIRLCTDRRGFEFVEIDGQKSQVLRAGILGGLGGAYQNPRELLTPFVIGSMSNEHMQRRTRLTEGTCYEARALSTESPRQDHRQRNR